MTYASERHMQCNVHILKAASVPNEGFLFMPTEMDMNSSSSQRLKMLPATFHAGKILKP